MKEMLRTIGSCIIAVLLIIGCSNCHSSRLPPDMASDAQFTQNENKTPPISFFTFFIKKTGKTTVVSLTNQEHVDGGRLKNRKTIVRNPNAVLTVDFYHGSTLLGSQTLDHPLHRTLEGASEEGGFQTVALNQDSATFFVRVQYAQPITEIHFTETLNDKKQALNTIQFQ